MENRCLELPFRGLMGLSVKTCKFCSSSVHFIQQSTQALWTEARIFQSQSLPVLLRISRFTTHLKSDIVELPQARQGTGAAEKLPSSSTADTCQGLASRAMEDSDGESAFGIAFSGLMGLRVKTEKGSECEWDDVVTVQLCCGSVTILYTYPRSLQILHY